MPNKLLPVLKKVILRSPFLAAGLVLAILGSIVLALLPPLALERIVNALALGNFVPLKLAFAYFLLLAISGLFDAAKEILITMFGQKITHGVRSEMCAKLSRLPASYFTKNEPGVTVSRFVNDVDTVDALFSSGIISMFTDACKVISILVVIFLKSKGLGILMLLVTPALFAMTYVFQKSMKKAQLENRVAVGRANNHVPETIRNIRMIHTFGKERYMEKRYDDYIQDGYRAMEKSNFYDSIYSPIILVISAVVIAIMMIGSATGGQMQAFFGMSVGTAVAIINYVGKVFSPLESIGMEIQNIQSAVAGVSRINEFLQEPEKKDTDPSLTADVLFAADAPSASLSHVSFGYGDGQTVLSDCNFTVTCGEQVTLTGRTGSGKSTIFRLLLGLYSPQSGSVKVFGADADRIPDSQKRKLFGYVEQSFRPVPGTVEDQITLFDWSVSHEAAVEAAKTAGIHETILSFEKGYETPFAESLFSQGQLQLLSIARAVAADPPILLLDEITANLDSQTEETVLSALQSVSQNRTVLSISHRLYERHGGREIRLTAE